MLMKNRIATGVILAALVTATSPLFADTLAVSSSPAPSAAPPTGSLSPLAPIEAHTLPNGLRVILSPQRDTARVAINLVYHVGFRDQPPGYRGLPHLLEHAMFEGSRHVPAGQYVSLLEQAGATVVNGTTASQSLKSVAHSLFKASSVVYLSLSQRRKTFIVSGRKQ